MTSTTSSSRSNSDLESGRPSVSTSSRLEKMKSTLPSSTPSYLVQMPSMRAADGSTSYEVNSIDLKWDISLSCLYKGKKDFKKHKRSLGTATPSQSNANEEGKDTVESMESGRETGIQMSKTTSKLSYEEKDHQKKLQREIAMRKIELNNSNDPRRKILLERVVGSARDGQMVAIMGSSGAGKSTLLDCLAMRNRKFLGHVYFNEKLAGQEYANLTAYIPQYDLFYPVLTVKEHLSYHATVRLAHLEKEERLERMVDVVTSVGLQQVFNSIIGGEGTPYRGLSGGEKKRLSVATELLSNPAVIFADEPTSGLDSYIAYHVLEVMKEIAGSGKLVFSVVHQPAVRLLELFSHLILLAKGRVVYHGEISNINPYFNSIGYPCPEFFNPADHVIMVISMFPTTIFEDYQRILELAEKFEDSDAYADVAAWHEIKAGQNGLQGKALSSSTTLDFDDKNKRYNQVMKKRKEKPGTANLMVMTWENTIRSLISYAREPMLTVARVVQSTITAVILGLIYFRVADTTYTQDMIDKYDWDISTSFHKVIGALFVATLNQGLLASLQMLVQYPSFIAVFNREYLNTANNAFAMYWGRSIAELPYQFVIPLFFTTIFYFMMGMGQGGWPEIWDNFIYFSLMIISLAWTSVSFAQAISILVLDTKIALYISVLFWFPMAIYTGLMKPLGGDNVPDYFEWLVKVSFVRYAYTGLIINYLEQPHVISDLLPEAQRQPLTESLLRDNMGVEPDTDKWGLLYTTLIIGAVLKLLGYIFLAFRVMTLKK